MARPKKPTYEWLPKRREYRKRIKDVDGKYVAIYAATPDELTIKVQEAQRQIEEAVFRKENPTVQEYAERWLQMRASHVRSTTLADYRSKIKNYIVPQLGPRRMAEITPDDIDIAIAPAAAKSASIYRSVQMLYKAIWASAQKSGIITFNPCEDLNPKGGTPAQEKKALTDQQVSTLLEAVRNLPVYPFVMLGLYAGLRREEILGLQWDCVFLSGSAPHILVRRAWRIEHNRPVVTEQLKTRASRRTVPLPPQLVECLQELSRESEYVITRGDGALTGTQWRRMWDQIVARSTKERTYTRYRSDGSKEVHTVRPVLGQASPHNPNCVCSIDFDVTPHQLRHTYVTNLLLAGVDIKSVQALAGHENSRITLDIYAHLTYNQPEDLISKVTRAFAKSPNY